MKGGDSVLHQCFIVGVKSDNPIITKQCDSYQWKTDGISHFDDFVADRKNTFSLSSSYKIAYQGTIGVPKELTITKKRVETLRVMLDTASSIFPKCSMATKNRNHGAI